MFKAVLEKGKSMKSPPLSLRYFNSGDMPRLGFIVRKKTGNAVLRNDIRRVLREVFRLRMGQLPLPAWFVFDVMPQANAMTRQALRLKAEELLDRWTAQAKAVA
jgi:ribonuclease P protein component